MRVHNLCTFASGKQRLEVIRTLLSSLQLEHLWTESGPTDEAVAILDGRRGMSHGERVLVLVAWDLWNGQGNAPFYQVLYVLDPKRAHAIGSLLVAWSAGRVDHWIHQQGEPPPPTCRGCSALLTGIYAELPFCEACSG